MSVMNYEPQNASTICNFMYIKVQVEDISYLLNYFNVFVAFK